MIETDDSFEPLSDGWDYLVDFLDLSFPTERPEREHCYLEVRRACTVLAGGNTGIETIDRKHSEKCARCLHLLPSQAKEQG